MVTTTLMACSGQATRPTRAMAPFAAHGQRTNRPVAGAMTEEQESSASLRINDLGVLFLERPHQRLFQTTAVPVANTEQRLPPTVTATARSKRQGQNWGESVVSGWSAVTIKGRVRTER